MNLYLRGLFVCVILGVFFPLSITAKPSNNDITYSEIRYWAINDCRSRKPQYVDTEVIDLLIKLEQGYDVPPSLRGMVLAAACMESGYNPSAKGDYRLRRGKKRPRAIGILQQWPVYEKAYGTNRLDISSAVAGWMEHIITRIPKVTRQCKFKSRKKIWLAAWVTGVRYPKPGGRCYETVKHYKILKRWHRKIRKQRRSSRD